MVFTTNLNGMLTCGMLRISENNAICLAGAIMYDSSENRAIWIVMVGMEGYNTNTIMYDWIVVLP